MLDCPVCTQIRLEFGNAAQQEAKATLEQRSGFSHAHSADDRTRYEALQRTIDESRKRQAKLAEVLDRHLAEHSAA